MKGNVLRWGLVLGLLGVAFYSLHGDNSIPDFVLDSVHLLKKPVEDLLPDLQEDNETAAAVESATLDLEPYQDLHNDRERWNEMRRLIEAGQPLFTPLPSEVELSTSPVGRLAPAVPPPPGFTVSLPYESRLTVSGRKTIGMTVYVNFKLVRIRDFNREHPPPPAPFNFSSNCRSASTDKSAGKSR